MAYQFNEQTSLEYKWNKKKVQSLINNIIKKNDVVMYKNQEYLTDCFSFDIETTSIFHYAGSEKRPCMEMGFMYIWMAGINGQCIHGRTWEEFIEFINLLKQTDKKIVIWVHNLSYEFQFMRKLFTWGKTFFIKKRSILYCETDNIIFRDSLAYGGYSLEKLAEHLTKYKISKKVGDLDYSLIRNSKTTLSELEMSYCISDVVILNNYIQEEKENFGFEYILENLTKTSKVRTDMRMNCFFSYDEKTGQYTLKQQDRKFIKSMKLTSDDYRVMRRAYQGGFTHANKFNVGRVFEYVDSFDFTSSYPAVILSEKFPIASFKVIQNIEMSIFKQYIEQSDTYASIFDIEFNGVQSKGEGDDILSKSKCWEFDSDSLIENNGRIVECDRILTTMTEIDFKCFCKFYTFESFTIKSFRYALKGYLPKWFIEGVLAYYKDKTQFKDDEDHVVEYNNSKEKLNSIYGMLVEDLIHNPDSYDLTTNEYNDIEKLNSQNISDEELDKIIMKYNKNKNRFSFFAWGVYITAYARRNLFTAILELKNDYLYSDTDSVKFINYNKHKEYFENYNKQIVEKIDATLKFYNIDIEESRPMNKKGKKKQIGVWDWETEKAKYTKFKTLGAKRYMYEQNDVIHTTIAGLSKKEGAKYISQQKNPFDFFNDDMKIPSEYTGKLTHFYIDEEKEMDVTDYQGNTVKVKALSGIALVPCEFNLSISDSFNELLESLSEESLDDDLIESNVAIK